MIAAAIDPITLEVVRNKLDTIADEMEITIEPIGTLRSRVVAPVGGAVTESRLFSRMLPEAIGRTTARAGESRPTNQSSFVARSIAGCRSIGAGA